jgi:hypothetical protein
MIVRILGGGQLRVDDTAAAGLNELDAKLSDAIEGGDESEFRRALKALVAGVRAAGTPVAPDSLQPSELILPYEDADLAEVREMMTGEGLIPGTAG